MIDFHRLSVSLEELISKKKYTQYIELLQTSFQQASTTQDVDNLLVLLFKIELEYKIYTLQFLSNQYKTFLLFVKKIICELLSQGIIPHKEYLHLYNIFSHFDFSEDNNIVTLLDFFKNDIKTLPWDSEDKFTENNIILLLEIINGSKKEALLQYIKNILLTNIHLGQNGLHCQFINGFSTSTDHFTIDLLIEAMNYYLNPIIYKELSLNEKKSLSAWGYELFLNNTKFTKNSKVTELYTPLKKLIQIHIEKDEIEELMYIEFFTMISQFTVYQKNEESEKFNQEITYPAGKAYAQFSIDNNLIQPKRYNNKKKKIAFIFERLVEHSPFKITVSLLQELQKNTEFRENYEIEVYSLNYFLPLYNIKDIEQLLTEIGIKVIYPSETYLELDNYSNRLERVINIREKIIKNKIDIMIACFNSYDILNFLFASRTANKQIYWSHGNYTYNIEGIDDRISHAKSNYPVKYFYEQFDITYQDSDYVKKINSQLLKDTVSLYPSDKIILGTIGRLIKIDNLKYLNSICSILKDNDNTIYLACGEGNKQSIIDKINLIDKSLITKFFFPGYVNQDIYGKIIHIWPDTFPFQQGKSKNEAASNGICVVVLQKKHDNRHCPIQLQEEVKKYYPEYKGNHRTTIEYCNFITELINNIKLRRFWSKYILNSFYNNCINNKKSSLIEFLKEIK